MRGRIARGILCAVTALAFATTLAADRYPGRVVRIINPYPPRGSVDVMARLLAQKLTRVVRISGAHAE